MAAFNTRCYHLVTTFILLGFLGTPSVCLTTAEQLKMVKLVGKLISGVDGTSYEDIPPFVQTKVYASVIVNNLTSVSAVNQEFSLDIILNMDWTDPRLSIPNITDPIHLPDRYRANMWIPDIGFTNALTGRVLKVTDDFKALYLSPNGSLYYTNRLIVVFRCLMDFSYYPMDTQLCEMQLESWRYNYDQLRIEWRSEEPYTRADFDVFQYKLTIDANRSRNCTVKYEGRGRYDCLELDFVFKRILEYYYLDFYIPSLLIVIISFIALFIDYNVVPSRVNVGTLSITAMTNILRAMKSDTPQVAYAKASDVWVWACQFFVFFVFLEYGFVNVLNRMYRKSYSKEKAKDDFINRSPPAKTLDKISRIFFPGCFVIFNIVYWSVYLTLSDYHNPNLARDILARSRKP